jgi:hypothetical protein
LLSKIAFRFPDGPLKGWQLAALFVPFLFPLLEAVRKLGLLSSVHPLWTVGIYFLVILWVVVFGAGLAARLPTWALPSIGIALFLISVAVLGTMQGLVLPRTGWPDPIHERVILMMLRDLLFIPPMLLILALILKAASNFQQRVREDWSLLSLLIYGMAIPTVILYDEYQGRGIYEITALLLLAAGLALFLVLPSRWTRLLVLILGVMSSAAVMSFGIYQLFPAQYFATPEPTFRIWESIQPLLLLPALVILLGLTSLYPRLPLEWLNWSAFRDYP